MDDSGVDDAALVQRARGGDLDAYGALVQRYQDQALASAYIILKDRPEAEDAAQEAFTSAFLALHRFKPDGSFRAWLLRIVINEARTLRAARRRRGDLQARLSVPSQTSAHAPSAEGAALSQGRREALLEALFDLPETDRLIITCRYFLDLSEQDMADVLRIARGTVKSRLSRALVRLGPILRELGPLVLVPPAADVRQAVLQRLGPGGPNAPPLSSSGKRVQHGLTWLAAASSAVAIGAVVLLSGQRATPTAAVPAPPEIPPGRTVVVYGADASDADRQELSVYFGAAQPTTTDTVSRLELADSLRAQGMPVSPTDEAISSARVVCPGGSSGLDIETQNISRIPAAAYAGALLTAGLNDAQVTMAAPSSRSVSGETALVGVIKAYPACSAGRPIDPHRLQLAYEQLQATTSLASDTADMSAASAVVLQVLHAVITGQAQGAQDVAAALSAASSAHGVTLDGTARTTLVDLFEQLRGLDYGPYAHGYRVEQPAPDHVRVVVSDGD
jgi:RNA polymerase sigma factor (sigma-70 family)